MCPRLGAEGPKAPESVVGGAQGPGGHVSKLLKLLEALGHASACFEALGGSWRLWVMLQQLLDLLDTPSLSWRILEFYALPVPMLRQVCIFVFLDPKSTLADS